MDLSVYKKCFNTENQDIYYSYFIKLLLFAIYAIRKEEISVILTQIPPL